MVLARTKLSSPHPQSCVFWQQVNAICLYYKAAPDEKIY